MGSDLATRMWRICTAAKRPWPVLDEDDVIDYMVMEAVGVKAMVEDERNRKEAQKKKEVDQWKHEKSEALEGMRDG